MSNELWNAPSSTHLKFSSQIHALLLFGVVSNVSGSDDCGSNGISPSAFEIVRYDGGGVLSLSDVCEDDVDAGIVPISFEKPVLPSGSTTSPV